MSVSVDLSNLREFKDRLSQVSVAPKVREAQLDAARIMHRQAQSRVPVMSGRAKGSVRVLETQMGVRLEGGIGVPYFGWLDFGGSVGRNKVVHRPYLKTGRYIWKAFSDNRAKIMDMMENAAKESFTDAGINVE